MIEKILKILGTIFWIFLIVLMIFWYSKNKDEFFPSEKIKKIPNPINPFE